VSHEALEPVKVHYAHVGKHPEAFKPAEGLRAEDIAERQLR